MPLIRFRIGDMAEQGETLCACGAPFSTIAGVKGRMLDMFPLPDGRVIHAYYLTETLVMDDPDWIECFQLTQHRVDRITMQIVPRRPPNPLRIEAIRAHGAQLLGPGVEFELAIVESIPSDPSGKFRPARSLVTSSYDGVLAEAGVP
jgi:phenylacetate-CoA ligase